MYGSVNRTFTKQELQSLVQECLQKITALFQMIYIDIENRHNRIRYGNDTGLFQMKYIDTGNKHNSIINGAESIQLASALWFGF